MAVCCSLLLGCRHKQDHLVGSEHREQALCYLSGAPWTSYTPSGGTVTLLWGPGRRKLVGLCKAELRGHHEMRIGQGSPVGGSAWNFWGSWV